MTFVCLDAGNTRLKWGLVDETAPGHAWLARGALEWLRLAELSVLLADALAQTPQATPLKHAFLGSVTSATMERNLVRRLRGLPLTRLVATTTAAGVANGYADPECLGVDRWCALIGARALEKRACLVVMAGTATTIDSLDESGRFTGGLILPGIELMRRALNQGTARLPLAEGQYVPSPDNTRDAIATGCLDAQVGAIERAFRRSPHAGSCLLSGGAADMLSRHLRHLPVRMAPNLALEGMRHWALKLIGDA
ncbi:MAG: type III pantothenate kinase [Zoogloeaceae bacterium]|nr:type III pantothenate kinase [Zoogloeaceae bacterium]